MAPSEIAENTTSLKELQEKVEELTIKIRDIQKSQEWEDQYNQDNESILVTQSANPEGKLLENTGNVKAMNDYLQELSLHEYQKVQNILEKDHSRKNQTIMDQPLGETMDKTVNFMANSIDKFYQKYYEAKLMDTTTQEEDQGFIYKAKIYFLTLVLFARDEENIIYLGILCIIISIIMLFFNITTS